MIVPEWNARWPDWAPTAVTQVHANWDELSAGLLDRAQGNTAFTSSL
jgi:hypothetical protein